MTRFHQSPVVETNNRMKEEARQLIKPVTFKNEGQQLVGVLHIPERLKIGQKVPGVVMLHGFTGNKVENHRLFVHAARKLCDSGFVVLRFDFRGSGDSDGEFEDMTILAETSDAEKALTFLVEQKWIDKKAVGILGLSMGGRVAAILASKDKRVGFVILYSAALSPLAPRFLSGIKGYQPVEAMRRTLNTGEAIKVKDGWYLKNSFFETVDDIVPLKVMDRIRIPVLIVHGSKDQVVPVSDSIQGFKIVKDLNERNELCVLEGADHVFTDIEHTRQVIGKTLEWLNSLDLQGRHRTQKA